MSNISRRDFMKTAGVMTLAVAASGVLAGCSTSDAADNKVTEVTSNSVTVGDYTITVKDAKRYSVKSYQGTDGKVTEDGSAKTEDQYLYVLVNVKTAKDDSKSEFTVTPGTKTNLTTVYTELDTGDLKKLFGLSVEPTQAAVITSISTDGKSVVPINNRTADGSPYVFAYKLKADSYDDGTWEFKTPALTFIVTNYYDVNDSYGEYAGYDNKRISLPVTIPSTAETKKSGDIGL